MVELICQKDLLGDLLINKLNLKLREDSKRFYGPCPIHNGDSPQSFSIYKNSGIFQCFSHKCHNGGKYLNNLIDKIKGNSTSTLKTFLAAHGYSEFKIIPLDKEKRSFIREYGDNNFDNGKLDFINSSGGRSISNLSRNEIRSRLIIPSPYFISRGFSIEVLHKYDVGDCLIKGKKFSGRAVVPVYNSLNKYVGATARIINSSLIGEFCSKWKIDETLALNKRNCLYNENFCSENVVRDLILYIIESAGNTWRLSESGYGQNCMALLG
ncbi:MAG: CHC2 zinc finger domain-containing protein, partial [Nanoarchaeota archaeon]